MASLVQAFVDQYCAQLRHQLGASTAGSQPAAAVSLDHEGAGTCTSRSGQVDPEGARAEVTHRDSNLGDFETAKTRAFLNQRWLVPTPAPGVFLLHQGSRHTVTIVLISSTSRTSSAAASTTNSSSGSSSLSTAAQDANVALGQGGAHASAHLAVRSGGGGVVPLRAFLDAKRAAACAVPSSGSPFVSRHSLNSQLRPLHAFPGDNSVPLAASISAANSNSTAGLGEESQFHWHGDKGAATVSAHVQTAAHVQTTAANGASEARGASDCATTSMAISGSNSTHTLDPTCSPPPRIERTMFTPSAPSPASTSASASESRETPMSASVSPSSYLCVSESCGTSSAASPLTAQSATRDIDRKSARRSFASSSLEDAVADADATADAGKHADMGDGDGESSFAAAAPFSAALLREIQQHLPLVPTAVTSADLRQAQENVDPRAHAHLSAVTEKGRRESRVDREFPQMRDRHERAPFGRLR